MVVQAKLIDCPDDLSINACAQCVADFAEHCRVALRMLQQLQNQLYADIAGFGTAAPALCDKLFYIACLDFAVYFGEAWGNNAR